MEEQGTEISFLSRVQWSLLGTQAMSRGSDAENRSDRPSRPNETDLKGNGNPLQCSCLENPRDGGAWWAAVYGVSKSWT